MNTMTSLPPPPRSVRGGVGCGVWFVRLFTLPHTLIGIGLLLNIPLTILWALAGTELPATILRGETSTSRKGGVSYTLHYRYAAGGQSFENSDGVGEGIYYKYMVGDRLKQPTPPAAVRYFGFGPARKVKLVEEA